MVQTSRWPVSRLPISNIQPFTYRDGETYLSLLNRLAEYITTQLHPNLRQTVEEMVEEMEHILADQHGKYVEGIQDFQRIHDAFMTDVNSALMALNDNAVADLADDPGSVLGNTLRDMFASADEFQGLGNVVVTGDLTVAKIMAADQQAQNQGRTLVVSGTLETDETLTITGNADFSNMRIRYSGVDVALQIGVETAGTHRKNIRLPYAVTHTRKVHTDGSGWGAVQGTIGVRVVNLNSSILTVPFIEGFDEGFRMEGTNRLGNTYNTIHMGQLYQNRINYHQIPTHRGWTGQHTVIGGRYSHVSPEGTLVPGVEHILFTHEEGQHNPDNTIFINPSVEGVVPQYAVSLAGNSNIILNGRYESPNQVTVRWKRGAQRNQILYGWGAYRLEEQFDEGAAMSNSIIADRVRKTMSGSDVPVYQISNSSDGPSIGVYSATLRRDGGDPAKDWATLIGNHSTEFKTRDDAHPRIKIWNQYRRISFGDGSQPMPSVGSTPGIGVNLIGEFEVHADTMTMPGGGQIGRPDWVDTPSRIYAVDEIISRNAVTSQGWYDNGNFPDASDYSHGAMMYNRSLNKPVWSDGSIWRDANGDPV